MQLADPQGDLIATGVLLTPFFVGLYFFVRIRRSQGWPSTKGVITHTDMKVRATGKGGHSYEPIITYGYRVGVTEFSSQRVKIINMVFGDKFGSEYRLEQYPVGKEVDVFYNPGNPRDSILEKSSVLTCACYMALDLMFIALIWTVWIHQANS